MIRSLVKELLHYINLDIRRYSIVNSHDLRRRKVLDLLGIDLVLDVGANSGQYAKMLRKDGYNGKILSFEPISTVYNELKKVHWPDRKQLVAYTGVVLVAVTIVGLIIWVFDQGLSFLITKLFEAFA